MEELGALDISLQAEEFINERKTIIANSMALLENLKIRRMVQFEELEMIKDQKKLNDSLADE